MQKTVKQTEVYYDAHCDFCNRCRIFIEQNSHENTFTFSETDDTESITVISLHGKKMRKSAACLYIAQHMTFPWNLFGYIGKVIPRLIGDWLYDQVARHRTCL